MAYSVGKLAGCEVFLSWDGYETSRPKSNLLATTNASGFYQGRSYAHAPAQKVAASPTCMDATLGLALSVSMYAATECSTISPFSSIAHQVRRRFDLSWIGV